MPDSQMMGGWMDEYGGVLCNFQAEIVQARMAQETRIGGLLGGLPSILSKLKLLSYSYIPGTFIHKTEGKPILVLSNSSNDFDISLTFVYFCLYLLVTVSVSITPMLS